MSRIMDEIWQEGWREGFIEGYRKEKIKWGFAHDAELDRFSAQRMLRYKMLSVEDIAALTGLSVAEVEAIAASK